MQSCFRKCTNNKDDKHENKANESLSFFVDQKQFLRISLINLLSCIAKLNRQEKKLGSLLGFDFLGINFFSSQIVDNFYLNHENYRDNPLKMPKSVEIFKFSRNLSNPTYFLLLMKFQRIWLNFSRLVYSIEYSNGRSGTKFLSKYTCTHTHSLISPSPHI